MSEVTGDPARTLPVHHMHIATGLPGSGPDGSEGFIWATSWIMVSDLLGRELNELAEDVGEQARATAEVAKQADRDAGFREAWELLEQSERLDHIAMEFSLDRIQAPLYADDHELWVETMQRLLEKHFGSRQGGRLRVSDRLTLHVWECKGGESCEHYEGDSDE